MLKTSLERRVDALGIPRILLADLAGVHANDATAWIKGRALSAHRRDALVQALKDVEAVMGADKEVRVELTVANIRAAQKRLDEKRAASNAGTILATDEITGRASAVARPVSPAALATPGTAE